MDAKDAPMRVVTKSLSAQNQTGWEAPRPGQRVLASFKVWRRAGDGPLGDEPGLAAARDAAPPVCVVEKQLVTVDAPAPPPPPYARDADGLDEWLMVPRPTVLEKAPYVNAVDDALKRTKDGERLVYETLDHGGFVVEVEVHEILTENELIKVAAGFVRTRRLRTTSRSQVARPPTSGCTVRGTLRVVDGSLTIHNCDDLHWSWFGLGAAGHAFEARLGDGFLSEGFAACLVDVKQGTVARCTIAGECLLPDAASLDQQASVVPPRYWAGDQGAWAGDLPTLVLELAVAAVDETTKKSRDPMTASLKEKEVRAHVLKARGAALYEARRFRRAERVWHEGVRLFGFWKPEDSVMDPHDLHLAENNKLRALSNPLLLNEALLMRRRGAFREAETNCSEVLENAAGSAKAFFRRGQVRVDLQKWEGAKGDLRKALECDASIQGAVDKELNRLRKLERRQDAKDGKALKHTFDADRESIYEAASTPGVERALQDIRADAARRREGKRPPTVRRPVTKTSSQKDYDWTTSYSKARPAYTTSADDRHRPVVVDSLAAEIDDISDEEEEERRRSKQDYYNAQIALGNMRVQLPPPGVGS